MRAGATPRSAPAPMSACSTRRFSLPGQPRDRSPSLTHILAESGVKSGQRIGAIGWKPFSARGPRLRRDRARPALLHRRHAALDRRRTRRGRQRRRSHDEPGRRPSRHQRGRPARRLRIRRDLHLARRAQRARQHRARHERARGGAADRHERPAAVRPPDADGGQARLLRPAEPEPRRDQPRRSGHGGLWRAWRAQCPRRLPGRGAPPNCRTTSATMSTNSSRPIFRPPSTGTRRSASASPAARCGAPSTIASATRSSASRSIPAISSTSTNGCIRRSFRARRSRSRSGMALQVDVIPATGSP